MGLLEETEKLIEMGYENANRWKVLAIKKCAGTSKAG